MAWTVFTRVVGLLGSQLAALPGYAQPLHYLSICCNANPIFHIPPGKESVFKHLHAKGFQVSLEFREMFFMFSFFCFFCSSPLLHPVGLPISSLARQCGAEHQKIPRESLCQNAKPRKKDESNSFGPGLAEMVNPICHICFFLI